ncbi:MAG: glycosyltransferase family 4 protein [bacterium]
MTEYAGKVLMLVENLFPTDPRVRREASTLVQAGYKVSVIALRRNESKSREIVNGVHVYRIPRIELFKKGVRKKSWFSKLRYYIGSTIGYAIEYFYFTAGCYFLSFYVLVREGFDVVHVHNPPDTLFLIGAFYKLLGKKFVFDHHDLSPELYLSRFAVRGGLMYRGLLLVEKLCLRAADLVIATNESYKKIIIERGNKKPEQVFVVRNGPDLDRIQLRAPDPGLKKLNKKILGYVGAMNPQDGVDYLLRALQHLVYEMGRKDFYCVIIGSGDSRRSLQALAEELRIREFVWFTGFIPDEDVLRYLSTADICVDPDPSSPLNDVSTWIKIMEYMALGKPIVSFDLAETRVSAQQAALYAAPNDEKAFARAIVRLMDDPQLRAKMGAFGRKRIEQELAWHHGAKNLLVAYHALLPKTKENTRDIGVAKPDSHELVRASS